MSLLFNSTLSPQERAAVAFYALWPDTKITDVYRLAAGLDATAKTANYPRKWFALPKVQAYLRQCNERLLQLTNEAREDGARQARLADGADGRDDAGRVDDVVGRERRAPELDYSDPANQRRLLNDIINRSDDVGDQLDAVKVLISGQKDDKEAAKARRQVQFYLPLRCSECPLYRAASAKMSRDATI